MNTRTEVVVNHPIYSDEIVDGQQVDIETARFLQTVGVMVPNKHYGNRVHPTGLLKRLFVAKYIITWRPAALPEPRQYAVVNFA